MREGTALNRPHLWLAYRSLPTAAGDRRQHLGDQRCPAGDQLDLNASTADLQRAVSAYLLVTAALVVPSGQLGDIFGRRKLFLIGLALFTLSSVVIALSPNSITLILGQGLRVLVPPP